MIDNNPFLFTPEEDEEFERSFWEGYPRWTFRNLWTRNNSFPKMRTFCLLNVWSSNKGAKGITLFNFSVEFNPYHKEKSE